MVNTLFRVYTAIILWFIACVHCAPIGAPPTVEKRHPAGPPSILFGNEPERYLRMNNEYTRHHLTTLIGEEFYIPPQPVSTYTHLSASDAEDRPAEDRVVVAHITHTSGGAAPAHTITPTRVKSLNCKYAFPKSVYRSIWLPMKGRISQLKTFIFNLLRPNARSRKDSRFELLASNTSSKDIVELLFDDILWTP